MEAFRMSTAIRSTPRWELGAWVLFVSVSADLCTCKCRLQPYQGPVKPNHWWMNKSWHARSPHLVLNTRSARLKELDSVTMNVTWPSVRKQLLSELP